MDSSHATHEPPAAAPHSMFDAADEEVAAYRGLSSPAVLGLVAGLLSPLAMFASGFLLLPLAAVGLAGLGLWRIEAQSPSLIGRKAALVGLLLGTVFLVASPVEGFVYRYLVRQEARRFAAVWIDAVQHGEVYKAHHLMIDPKRRAALDRPLAPFYLHNDSYRRMLDTFVDQPVVRTLFALGTKAKIRYYETAAEGQQESGDYDQLTYAVTYDDQQKQRRTFFITLLMSRTVDRADGRPDWTLIRVDGGVRPSGW